MFNSWIWLVLFYGVVKGIRDIIKKKSLEKSTIIEVLFFYTLVGFILVLPQGKAAFGIEIKYIGYIFIKSLFVFTAWLCGFKAIEKLPVSFYGVMDLSGIVFSTVLSMLILGEVLTGNQIVGLIIVMFGLLLVNYKKSNSKEEAILSKYVALALLCCILNASSGLMDKVLMKHLDSSQLQFWYMLIMVLLYVVYIAVKKIRIGWRSLIRNYWIYIMSVIFIIGDKALFIANASVDSKVSVMILLKQSACFVTIIGGKFVFKEKNILYRMLCALLIVLGIFISVL